MYEAIMLANFLVWLGMLIVFLRQPYASIYHPFLWYLVFHFIVFTARAPLVYYRGYDFIYRIYEFRPSIEEKSLALAVAMLGLVAFGSACMYFGRTPITFVHSRDDTAERSRLVIPLAWTAVLLAPIAIYSLIMGWSESIVGESTMISDDATRTVINTTSNGYFYESRIMLGPLAMMFAWMTRFRWYSLLPLALFLVLGAGTGSRGPFVLAVVAAGLLWAYEHRTRWPTIPVAALLLVVAVLFNAVGIDRGQSVRGLFVQEQVERDVSSYRELRVMEGMDAGNLEYLEFVVYAVPGRTGTYGYFANLLQIFTEPIPRVLWPDKPVGEPIRMFNLFDVGNPVGMTMSLPGQGWMHLGWAGVVFWCGLFGGLWGWFYERFARVPTSTMRLVVYMTFLPLSILFFRDGAPITILRFGLFLAIPLFVLALLSSRARKSAMEGAAPVMSRVAGARRRAERAAELAGGGGAGRENRRRLASQGSGSQP